MFALPPNPDPILLDGLREIGNIGAAHATTALSNLIGRDITVEVSEHYFCPTQQLPEIFGDPEQEVVSVYLGTEGAAKGGIILMLTQGMAIHLVDMMLSRPHTERELDEVDRDAICEVGNICASAYLNAVAKFCGTVLLPSPPGVAVGMLHAILQYAAALADADADDLMVVRTQFKYCGSIFSAFILYLPDQETIRLLEERFRMA